MWNKILRWLDRIPTIYLILFAFILGLAPFSPEPHLVEKNRMLFSGTLTRPIDIFDLFMHLAPVLLLLAKVLRTMFLNFKGIKK